MPSSSELRPTAIKSLQNFTRLERLRIARHDLILSSRDRLENENDNNEDDDDACLTLCSNGSLNPPLG